MVRMRFTKTERQQFTPGTEVEWRNGTHWHPGVIAGPIYNPDPGDVWQYVPITHKGRSTATLSTGQRVTGRPTTVRLPVQK
jgi:hypothetical protein